MQNSKSSKPLTKEKQKELAKLLQKNSKDNRIQCSSAFAIAKSLEMSPGAVGKAANKLNIKISKCQLGCF